MALMSFLPLSVRYTAEFPHVLESSGVPPVPKPILESQLEQRSSLLLKIPILALDVSLQLQTALNPSLSQWYCKEAVKQSAISTSHDPVMCCDIARQRSVSTESQPASR